jgi:hypothetical protein
VFYIPLTWLVSTLKKSLTWKVVSIFILDAASSSCSVIFRFLERFGVFDTNCCFDDVYGTKLGFLLMSRNMGRSWFITLGAPTPRREGDWLAYCFDFATDVKLES